jgi:hypothetical protein
MLSHTILLLQNVGLLEEIHCQVFLDSFSISLCSLWTSSTTLF